MAKSEPPNNHVLSKWTKAVWTPDTSKTLKEAFGEGVSVPSQPKDDSKSKVGKERVTSVAVNNIAN